MTRYAFELAAAQMRAKRRKKPGSGALGKIETTTEEEIKKRLGGYSGSKPLPIHPSVASATCDELLQAGYSSVPRWQIPIDWRTRRGPDKR